MVNNCGCGCDDTEVLILREAAGVVGEVVDPDVEQHVRSNLGDSIR